MVVTCEMIIIRYNPFTHNPQNIDFNVQPIHTAT